jgi:hypothetical protein
MQSTTKVGDIRRRFLDVDQVDRGCSGQSGATTWDPSEEKSTLVRGDGYSFLGEMATRLPLCE